MTGMRCGNRDKCNRTTWVHFGVTETIVNNGEKEGKESKGLEGIVGGIVGGMGENEEEESGKRGEERGERRVESREWRVESGE